MPQPTAVSVVGPGLQPMQAAYAPSAAAVKWAEDVGGAMASLPARAVLTLQMAPPDAVLPTQLAKTLSIALQAATKTSGAAVDVLPMHVTLRKVAAVIQPRMARLEAREALAVAAPSMVMKHGHE